MEGVCNVAGIKFPIWAGGKRFLVHFLVLSISCFLFRAFYFALSTSISCFLLRAFYFYFPLVGAEVGPSRSAQAGVVRADRPRRG